MTKKYFFVLGNTADLAREEVRAVVPHQELFYDPPVLILETEKDIPFDRFGGVIKVGEVIDQKIVDYLKSLKINKIDFGISNYSKNFDDAKKIKRELVDAGIKARFVLPPRGETILSSVVVRKQLLTEFLIYQNIIAKTIWSQDFEDWGKRDYARPEVQAKIGMLPPKVARQMVNISRAENILDPFCGVGTILMEALTINIKAIGSDIDPKQIERTRKNLEFFEKKAPLFVADARRIFEKINNIDAIVTETDLGPKIGLDQLYLDCFTNWKGKVKTIVIALPSLNVIDKVKAIGYILAAGSFLYARPQALVKRHICVFKYGSY